MKTCTKCHIEKLESEFNKSNRGINGIDPQCRACQRREHTEWRDKNKDSLKSYHKTWHKRHPEQQALSSRKHAIKRKTTIIAAYGGKCACCGEAEPSFLSIDHIYNDGYRDVNEKGWRLLGAAMYSRLIKEGCPKDRYQLLCMNCNFGKRINGGICPHLNIAR